MKMKEDGIRGAAYSEDRAAEQLGITGDRFRGYTPAFSGVAMI